MTCRNSLAEMKDKPGQYRSLAISTAPVVLLLALMSGPTNGCGTGTDSGRSDTDSDADSDSDSDNDTDADTDSDTDTTDADTDTQANSYWDWSCEPVPDFPSGICGDYNNLHLLALTVNDVVVCAGPEEGGGGLAEFDGSSLSLAVLPASVNHFLCEGLWGNGEDVWAWGFVDSDMEDYRLFRRDGSSWVEEPVEGFEGCQSAPEYCTIQEMYTDASGLPHAVGWLDADWFPPIVGTRVVWERDSDTASWVIDDEAVFPGFEFVHSLTTGIGVSTHPLAVVSGETTYWGGESDGGASVISVASEIEDLIYPFSEFITWLGRSDTGVLFASTGIALMRMEGVQWEEAAGTACEDAIWNVCWYTGALDAQGNVYLAGGRGGFGDTGPDQWRIHRWDGVALTEILAPCPGESPYCGISDLSVAGNRLFAVGRRDNDCVLLWADIVESGEPR